MGTGVRFGWSAAMVVAVVSGWGGSAQAQCSTGTLPTVLDPAPPSGNVGAAGWHTHLDGDLAAIGDPWFGRTSGAEGAVHLFKRGPSGWVREAIIGQLAGADPLVWGVARLGDQTAVIARRSAPMLVVYERSEPTPGTGVWTRVGTLSSSYTFTFAVRGTTLVADKGTGFDVLERDRTVAGGYRVVGSLPAASAARWRGSPISIDGDRIAVAVMNAVDVYARQPGGSWTKSQTLRAPAGSPAGWRYGQGMAMRGGTLAASLVVDPETPVGISAPPGKVLVYTLDASGQFVHSQTLSVPGATETDGFGHSIGLDGDRLVVGASQENRSGVDSGALHLFRLVEGSWAYVGPMGVNNAPAATLGYSVTVDGTNVLGGATGHRGRGAGVFFDECALPPEAGSTPRCLPGVLGLVTYLQAFFAGDPFADYNQNGSVDVVDVFAFLNDWFLGCP